MTKDNFSDSSDLYARFRPAYPQVLFEYINSLVPHKEKAWDCGTGNGQIAAVLAATFEKVYATDISRNQINNAPKAGNIFYSVQAAESTDFEDAQFDLVTVAQALHWFNFDQFYNEVRRTAKKDAVICILAYGLLEANPTIDYLIHDFYNNKIGAYWDKERRYIDEQYTTILFPFKEIKTPEFDIEVQWTFNHMIGYLNTWSAVKHFIQKEKYNPVEQLAQQLKKVWEENKIYDIRFPLILRAGIIH